MAGLTAAPQLQRAAELQVEWLVHALKKRIRFPNDHVVRTDWLRAAHPELLWERLDATFPDGPPDWIGAFDLARLSGWEGYAKDNGGYFRRTGDPAAAWMQSQFGHRENLLDPDWTAVGICASVGVGGGKFLTWATFGSP